MHGQREHYTLNGPRTSSELELLSLIIGTASGSYGTRSIALELLQRFGGARQIAQVPVRALTQVPGLGPARAVRVHAACALTLLPTRDPGPELITSPQDAERWIRPALNARRREHLYALYLSVSGRPLALEALSTGSVDRTLVDPREVFRPALLLGARSLVLAHNHPSGDPRPSPEDRAVTRRVGELGHRLGVQLVDHLVLGSSTFCSLAEMGLLPAWTGDASALTGGAQAPSDNAGHLGL
jgi:DNA repair protein RadC